MDGADHRGLPRRRPRGANRRRTGPHSGVAVQLATQEAKARARTGDRRQTGVTLDHGRKLLDSLPYPGNPASHFVVDPGKFDFYAMDSYRRAGEDRMAATLASEVIRAGTSYDGTELAPMRTAGARVALGVAAARAGDLDAATGYGQEALTRPRKSGPCRPLASQELTHVLTARYPGEDGTAAWLDQPHDLRARAA